MNNNEDDKRILSGMPFENAVFRCGELQLSLEDTVRLVCDKIDHDRDKLLNDLRDPESKAYEWYQNGVSNGNLKLNIDLEYNVGDPKAKEAYKNLSAERRRQAVNKKLDELFGI